MDLECSAGISKISIKAKEEDGIISRRVRMHLEREFDALIVRAIGGDANALCLSLEQKSCTKVEIPIDALHGECRLKGEQGDEVTIKFVDGVKAIGKTSADEVSGPRVEMVFEFPLQLSAWDFFGKNIGARAVLHFSTAQLDLPQTNDSGSTGESGKKGKPSRRSEATPQ